MQPSSITGPRPRAPFLPLLSCAGGGRNRVPKAAATAERDDAEGDGDKEDDKRSKALLESSLTSEKREG